MFQVPAHVLRRLHVHAVVACAVEEGAVHDGLARLAPERAESQPVSLEEIVPVFVGFEQEAAWRFVAAAAGHGAASHGVRKEGSPLGRQQAATRATRLR